jgi:hypothetical protein
MKKLILTLLLLQGSMVSSQEYFSFDLYFDPSAMATTDVNGDQQSSMNALVNVSVPIKTTDTGHFFLGQSVEYANLLDEEYFRYALLQVGYSFRSFIFKKMMASTAVNYGMTKRWSQGFTNYGATFDLSYNFSNRLKIASMFQVVRRSDMEADLGLDSSMFRSSFFIGLKLDLFRVSYI